MQLIIHMIMVLAENISFWFLYMKPKFACISSTVLFSFLWTISTAPLCVCDLEQPTTVVSKSGYRQAHVLEEGSRLWICLSAGSCCLPGESGANREVFGLLPRSFLCREAQSRLHSCAFGGRTLAEPAVRLPEGFSTSVPGSSSPA